MIVSLWPVALCLVLVVLGLPTGFASLLAGLAALVTLMEPTRIPVLLGTNVANMIPFPIAGAFIMLLLGGWLQGLGAVQTFPDRSLGAPRDADREPWFGGSILGAPLPMAVSIYFACLLLDVSIWKSMFAALPAAVVLTLLYIIAFVPWAARSRAYVMRGGAGRVDIVLIVLRGLVPVLALVVAFIPTHLGLTTPMEAMAITVVFLLVPCLIGAALSRGGWRRSGQGLMAGVRGIGSLLILVLGISVLSFALRMSGAMSKLYDGLSVPPLALMLAILAVTLVVGMAAGPLGAIGLVVIVAGPLLAKTGVDGTLMVVGLFLAAEAIRVGPRLWYDGFRRGEVWHGDGTVEDVPGGWPYYIAAVVVTLGFGAVVTTLL